MARVQSVARAEEVFRIYDQYAEFKPVQLHTGSRLLAAALRSANNSSPVNPG